MANKGFEPDGFYNPVRNIFKTQWFHPRYFETLDKHPQNFIYRYAARCNVHIFIVLPVCSFVLAFVLEAYGDNMVSVITELFFGVEIRKAITLGLLGYLALMHYYTEAFTWKQDSPYRRFIAFSK